MKILKFENMSYNFACDKLKIMMIDIKEIKSSANMIRYGFYDTLGNKVAEYREDTGVLKVYNYDTNCDFVNKVLTF
jgi:Ni,Fe-hydrogenase III large subunit